MGVTDQIKALILKTVRENKKRELSQEEFLERMANGISDHEPEKMAKINAN